MDDIKIYNFDTQNERLAPCPFCGDPPEWFVKGNDHTPSRSVVVKCVHCNVRMQISGRKLTTLELAERMIRKWNTRINLITTNKHQSHEQIKG
jgi:Lar family restriction alleviation protein